MKTYIIVFDNEGQPETWEVQAPDLGTAYELANAEGLVIEDVYSA